MNDTPIRSGVPLIDACFDVCVAILMWLADLFGVSYNTINIWIFCILWPLLTLGLLAIVLRQRREIRMLKICREKPDQNV